MKKAEWGGILRTIEGSLIKPTNGYDLTRERICGYDADSKGRHEVQQAHRLLVSVATALGVTVLGWIVFVSTMFALISVLAVEGTAIMAGAGAISGLVVGLSVGAFMRWIPIGKSLWLVVALVAIVSVLSCGSIGVRSTTYRFDPSTGKPHRIRSVTGQRWSDIPIVILFSETGGLIALLVISRFRAGENVNTGS